MISINLNTTAQHCFFTVSFLKNIRSSIICSRKSHHRSTSWTWTKIMVWRKRGVEGIHVDDGWTTDFPKSSSRPLARYQQGIHNNGVFCDRFWRVSGFKWTFHHWYNLIFANEFEFKENSTFLISISIYIAVTKAWWRLYQRIQHPITMVGLRWMWLKHYQNGF